MRDFDRSPYSPDEARIAKWLSDLGVGGGDDPIGFLLASHTHLAGERDGLWHLVEALVAEIKRAREDCDGG